MIEFAEIYEAARYANDKTNDSIKAGEKTSFLLSTVMRKLTQKNITAVEILNILNTLHEAQDLILMAKSQCKEASEELDRKILRE